MSSRRSLLFLMDTMTGGGAEKALLMLLRHLDPTKYDITLVLYLYKGVHLEAIPAHVEVKSLYPLGHKRLFEKVIFHSPWRHAYERMKLKQLIGEKHYDAIISYMEGPAAALHSLTLDRGNRNITWVHTDFAGNHWSKAFFDNDRQEQDFYAAVNDIVFVSADALSKFTFNISTPQHCIYNITDSARLLGLSREQHIDKKGVTLCFAGRLIPLKHVERMIDAIALLQARDIDVYGWILGAGPQEVSLKQRVSNLRLDDKITFLGFQSNPYPYISAADAVCMTSDVEGLPMIVQEAMALNTVVISTRCAGMMEVLDNDCGILCDNTADAFAAAIEQIVNDPTLKQHIANNAQQRIRQFAPEAIISQIEKLILNTDS